MKILLVDEQPCLELQSLMLESFSLTVDGVTSGEKALKMCSQNEYSTVLLNVDILDAEVYHQVRAAANNLPIILISSQNIDHEKFPPNEFNGFIQKPINLAKLKEALMPFVELYEVARFNRKTDIIFDKQELVEMLGDECAVMQVLLQFLKEHGHDCDKLNEVMDSENYPSAIELLHKLLCVTGNLFCNCLHENTTHFYGELKLDIINTFSLHLYNAVWKKTIGQLAEYACELYSKYKQVLNKKADWQTVWQDFYELCCEFDIDATNIFHENLPLFAENLTPSEFEFLQSAVNKYDYLSIVERK